MDLEPFHAIDLRDPARDGWGGLRHLTRNAFAPDRLLDAADGRRRREVLRAVVAEELGGPGDGLVRYFFDRTCPGRTPTDAALARFAGWLGEEFAARPPGGGTHGGRADDGNAADRDAADRDAAGADPRSPRRRPNLNFLEMGLRVGDVLTFDGPAPGAGTTVTVAGGRTVIFEGRETSLTPVTRALVGRHPGTVQSYWSAAGRPLAEIYLETYGPRGG